jgi:CheY-like chemotaxis protein
VVKSYLTVINDILDISKIETKKLELESIRFHLEKTIFEVIHLFKPQIEKKGLEFSFINHIENEFFIGDPIRIKQILTNLISNAVKFTDKCSIRIILSEDQIENNLSQINIHVSDTGVGIPKEAEHKLFHAFIQADTSITREFGGTGLGLTICKHLSELMEGSISFDSQLNSGTVFKVQIKLPRTEKSSEGKNKMDSNHAEYIFSESYPHQILLVEDNEINVKVASSFLEKLGYSCDIARNGQEALEQIEEKGDNFYTLILMDMQMPIMDGITATEIITNKYKNRKMKIIALTANAFDSDKKKCLNAGMDDFISKPMNKNKLKEILSKYSLRPQKKNSSMAS